MKYIRYSETWINKSKSPCKLFKFFKHNKPELQKVQYWLLEINDKGEVCREIAFNNKDQVVEFAPTHKNRGQWIDSNVTLDFSEYEEITHSKFENLWRVKKDEP